MTLLNKKTLEGINQKIQNHKVDTSKTFIKLLTLYGFLITFPTLMFLVEPTTALKFFTGASFWLITFIWWIGAILVTAARKMVEGEHPEIRVARATLETLPSWLPPIRDTLAIGYIVIMFKLGFVVTGVFAAMGWAAMGIATYYYKQTCRGYLKAN